jgi:hypothetical protein
MLNYLIKHNFKNYANSYIKQQRHKKNYLSTSQITQKLKSFNDDFSKSEPQSNLFKAKSPFNYKKIKFQKKIISTPLSEEPVISITKNKLEIKMKTQTNSPIHKKNLNKCSSSKKLINKKNQSIDLSLKYDKYNYYNNYISKNIIKNNNSYSNIINLTNNNIQTNFTSSVNNTATSLTNNNSNSISQNGRKKSISEMKSTDVKIKIKILYKNKILDTELNKCRNGLWLARKINEFYKIYLNEQQIHSLAEDLTSQINNIINCIINFPSIKDYGAIINITNLLDRKNKKFLENRRYKATMKYKNENYFFFINNNNDILDMANIIINDIIINKDKYNIEALKEEILKKINHSFNKTYSKNYLKTDINEN